MSAEFPPELIDRCSREACKTVPNGQTVFFSTVKEILRESGHAELVATLRRCRKGYLNINELYRIDTSEAITAIDAALAKAGAAP